MEPSPKEIRDQLERILLSQDFRASERLADFLRFVVDETLAGRAIEINQRTVGVKGLGYASNFDPQTNPAVRIQARRLRRALDQYYYTQGAADPIRIHIPKGSYVPVFLPNRDDTRDTEPAAEPSASTSATIKPQYAQPEGPSIAVLPLEYLGNGVENAFLASGITEEIVIALTRFPEFLVVGPLDRAIIRQKQLGSRGIGREYNVRFVLDGTVRLRDQTIRVTAKLTDARKGHQLWGEAHDYDIETATVDQLEEEIVGRVVAEIADNFGVIPRALAKEVLSHHDESLSAYEAVLRFHHHNRTLTEETLTNAIATLEEIVQRDPNHDLAMALLADLVGAPYFLGFVDDMSGLERAETLTRQALALNPKSQPAHFAMAQIHYQRFHQTACLAETEQVLALNPNNANYLAISALFLMGLGQGERSLALIQKAMRLNPHHPGWYHFVPFLNYYRQGEYEAALFEAKRFNTPEYFWDPLIRAAVLGQLDRRAEADRTVTELLVLVPDFENRGRSLIQRMVFSEENTEMLVAGLQKAGFETLSKG